MNVCNNLNAQNHENKDTYCCWAGILGSNTQGYNSIATCCPPKSCAPLSSLIKKPKKQTPLKKYTDQAAATFREITAHLRW
jgi:hypothetical protein